MRAAAVLLAAGEARRFGSPKQLIDVDGSPLVRRSAQAALDAGLDLFVVTGAYATEVATALEGLTLRLLHNPGWGSGMGGSIGVAFADLRVYAEHDHAVICLADQALIGAPQLRRLLAMHRSAPQNMTAARHGTTLGPPCVFPKDRFGELAALSGPQGARSLLERHAAAVTAVDLPEAAFDLDTPEDYVALAGTRSLKP